jgi:uncharacterized membrane protein
MICRYWNAHRTENIHHQNLWIYLFLIFLVTFQVKILYLDEMKKQKELS